HAYPTTKDPRSVSTCPTTPIHVPTSCGTPVCRNLRLCPTGTVGPTIRRGGPPPRRGRPGEGSDLLRMHRWGPAAVLPDPICGQSDLSVSAEVDVGVVVIQGDGVELAVDVSPGVVEAGAIEA